MDFATSFLSTAASTLASSAAAASAASTRSFTSSYKTDDSLPPLQISVWKVVRARHVTSGKQVSIWTADKAALGRGRGGGRDRGEQDRVRAAAEVLKKEAASLSRLRHPCILEMAEPLSESRSSLSFATEVVVSSLLPYTTSSPSSSSRRRNGNGNGTGTEEEGLDEVEVQKGFTQLAKALEFLHEKAGVVHGNLGPEAVVVNEKGDWKLSSFGLSAPYLSNPSNGNAPPAKWEFPQFDPALPRGVQRDLDYLAPEYLLDEQPPSPSNDMYSLGCLLHSLHTHTGPPFSHHNSLPSARANLEDNLSPSPSHNLVATAWRRLPADVQDVLANLVTRYPNKRLTARQFLQSKYFDGLLVGTLRFLERDSFAAQSSEQQASFLRGLLAVLPQFSDKVNRRKVLPSLLEETRKHNLVPFLLPNILHIAAKMGQAEFEKEVLPSLKPLFQVKEPPQAVVALLENLERVREKTGAGVFREEVMPLIYFSLEADNPLVLEKALRVVPGLCESLDYTTVKQTLFPKITSVFSKTTLLSVKVNTLICFHSMIPILDRFTLTEKLVPLLAKIKTKEPSVMIATLAVHEEMGKKCEVGAIATLILPQLWSMSVGPLLNVDQFSRFMSAIRTLSARVESEHSAHLAELKRLEESSGGGGAARANTGLGEVVTVGQGDVSDFESLVRGSVNGRKVEGLGARGAQVDIFADESPALTPVPTGNAFSSPPLPALPANSPPFVSPSSFASPAQPSRPSTLGRLSTAPASTVPPRNSLGARPIAAGGFNASAFPSPPAVSPQPQTQQPKQTPAAGLRSFAPLQPGPARAGSSTSLSSSTSASYATSPPPAQQHTPNYNLSLSTTTGGLPPLQPTSSSLFPSSASPAAPPQPIQWNRVPSLSSLAPSSAVSPSFSQPLQAQPPVKPASPLPPGYNPSSTLTPLQARPAAGGPNGANGGKAMEFGSWADLDPLK